MTNPVKITALTAENVKCVKAVHLEPSAKGLTIVGGKNNQGKTSVLDAIAWTLGGNGYRPSKAQREGSMIPPAIKLTLSNGLEVERKGKNSDLKVIDPSGRKAGQQLLNSFVEEFAINLPKFMEANNKEKANVLLQIIGVGNKLYELEKKEQDTYNQRRAIGQIADQKEKFAKEQANYPEAPDELISISDLISQQQAILAKNGENQRKREHAEKIRQDLHFKSIEVERLKKALDEAEHQYQALSIDYATAQRDAADLHDESTAELEQNIANIEAINLKVRANLDKEKAEEEAQGYRNQYTMLTEEIENIRSDIKGLLESADLPLEGLNVSNGDLLYNGQQWDNMSGSEQLKVATAIVRKLKPECGFVLIDKLEQMDPETLQEFGEWLEQEDLQAIATRVSLGDECSIIIEDGYVVEAQAKPKSFVAGQF